MARYTTTQEFSFGYLIESRGVVASGGTVTIDAWDGLGWVQSDVLTDGAKEVFTKGLKLRFTPSGGASYFIEESDR